jgi:hypothetical protein
VETKTFKLSDTCEVELAALNTADMMTVDAWLVPNAGDHLLTKGYAIAALRKINGMEVKPLENPAEFTNVAKRIGIAEIGKLITAFKSMLPDEPTGAELKNGSSAGT